MTLDVQYLLALAFTFIVPKQTNTFAFQAAANFLIALFEYKDFQLDILNQFLTFAISAFDSGDNDITLTFCLKIINEFRNTLNHHRLSLLFALLSVFLVVGQFIEFMAQDITRELSVEHNQEFTQSRVNISIEITVEMPCFFLHLDLLDATGEQQLDIKNAATFRRTKANGTVIGVANVSVSAVCLPCYGLLPETECCNSCEQLIILSLLRQQQPNTSEWVQCQHKTDANQPDPSERCLIKGKLTANKATGSFHIAIGRNVNSAGDHVHDLNYQFPHLNLGHRIERIRFGPKIPRTAAPLHNIAKTQHPGAPYMYKYDMQVTPVIHRVDGSVINTGFEYQAMSSQILLPPIGGQPGIYFYYHFSPYTVVINQRARSLIQFVMSTFGIVAGAFAIAAFLQSWIRKIQESKTK
jgi:hypothetical protein